MHPAEDEGSKEHGCDIGCDVAKILECATEAGCIVGEKMESEPESDENDGHENGDDGAAHDPVCRPAAAWVEVDQPQLEREGDDDAGK